jgi:hypothetical protein
MSNLWHQLALRHNLRGDGYAAGEKRERTSFARLRRGEHEAMPNMPRAVSRFVCLSHLLVLGFMRFLCT